MKAIEYMADQGEIHPDEKESTDLSLFVRTSDEEIRKWDKSRIFNALVRETDISPDAASIVARKWRK